MLAVKILEDGTAWKRWIARDFSCASLEMLSREQVQGELADACLNSKEGCGMCLTCKVHEAAKRGNN